MHTHLHERRDDTTHRALLERFIAGDLDLDGPRRDNAHEQARRSARIAAIEWMIGLLGAFGTPSGDTARERSVYPNLKVHLSTERGNHIDRRTHIGRIEHTGQA